MKPFAAITMAALLVFSMANSAPVNAYLADSTVPQTGGCPQPDHFNLSLASPLSRQWSTSLSTIPPTILTVATQGTSDQLDEIEQVISDSFGTWSGVSGTTLNATTNPGVLGPITRVTATDSCTNDQLSDADGLNTICFNQSSTGFSTGVLAFTRVLTATAPGATLGASGPAAFAGQILDADTLFRNDGQATFATPGALATTQGQGAYDLESLLIHELGHWFGFDHSAVWRAVMFPFAPPPGQFLGDRPTAQAPDGPLADDDRSGIRWLYPDPGDTTYIGAIRGQVLPANPFALAMYASPSPGSAVTGIFGAQVVAVDADTGSVIAATLGGWSCSASSSAPQFDGSFSIERLPLGHNYVIYAEPLVGLATPGDFSLALNDLCSSDAASSCTTPSANTNFNPAFRPATQ